MRDFSTNMIGSLIQTRAEPRRGLGFALSRRNSDSRPTIVVTSCRRGFSGGRLLLWQPAPAGALAFVNEKEAYRVERYCAVLRKTAYSALACL